MISIENDRNPSDSHIVGVTNFRYVNFYDPSNRKDAPLKMYSDIDGIRGDLALISLRNMLSRGYTVIAADGGSSPDFIEALDEFNGKGLTLIMADKLTSAGRAPQRRAAFKQAAALYPSKKVVCYYQPEKDLSEFFPYIEKEFLEQNADVALLGREAALFEEHYPPYMRKSELRVNKTYNRLMKRLGLMKEGEEYDWFFGSFLYRNEPRVAKLFTNQYELTYQFATGDPSEWIRSSVGALPNPEIFSGSHYFPIIEALFNRLRVIGIEIPYIYPKAQRDNEMSDDNIALFESKRVQIASAYLLEALHFLRFLEGNQNSKIREVKT